MSLIKNTTRGNKPRSNTTTRFSIALNDNNKVNFKLTGGNKLLGFINYYDNDLDNESGDVEVQETVDSLKADLAEVKMEDITLPMTAGEADDLIANL